MKSNLLELKVVLTFASRSRQFPQTTLHNITVHNYWWKRNKHEKQEFGAPTSAL